MNQKRKRFVRIVAAGLLCSVLLTGCGSQGSSDSAAQTDTQTGEQGTKSEPAYKELTVYSAFQDEESVIYFNAFEQDTGIKINFVRLSAGEMFARVRSEKNNPNATLIFGGNGDYYELAKSEDLLEEYVSPELDNVREDVKDADGLWSPVTEHAIGFACNTDWFKTQGLDYPTTWDELLSDSFKDQISISHPATAGTGYTIYMSMVEKLGEEEALTYYAALKNNVRQFTKGGTAPAMEVALGEAAVGIMYGDDALTVADQGYPIEVVYPTDGTGYEVTGMAILKGSPEQEQENAKTFIDWMLSVRGQEMFIESKCNHPPLNENAKAADGTVKLADINLVPHDAVWASANRERLIELFGERIDNPENVKS